jgi:hypothetical protein
MSFIKTVQTGFAFFCNEHQVFCGSNSVVCGRVFALNVIRFDAAALLSIWTVVRDIPIVPGRNSGDVGEPRV